MGNPCPFHGDPVIHHHVRAIVLLIQALVFRAENIRCQSLPLRCHGTDIPFKLREHGLAVDGALELVKEMVNEVGPFLLIGSVLQKVLHE